MFPSIHTEKRRPATELAAGLTDLALEVVRKAGVDGDTVEMELQLWRALTDALERESRWQRWVRSGVILPPDSAIAQVVHRAALDVAACFASDREPADLDMLIRPWVGRLPITPGLRQLLGKILAPRNDSSPRPLGRSGIVRKFRVTALN